MNEDERSVVINILGKVAPGLHEYLQEGDDIVHRLGTKRTDGFHQSLIILFDDWKSAKSCKFLQDNKMCLTEAPCPEDRAAREKLCPLVEKARKEGEKASFLGPYALIEGKKIDHLDIN